MNVELVSKIENLLLYDQELAKVLIEGNDMLDYFNQKYKFFLDAFYTKSDIYELFTLKHIVCRECGYKELPECIGNLLNLKELDLSGNKFEVFPESICKLVNLKELNISNNLLTEIPNDIVNLTKLERLDISVNQLYKLPKNIFSLSNLNSLCADKFVATRLSAAVLLKFADMRNIPTLYSFIPDEMQHYKSHSIYVLKINYVPVMSFGIIDDSQEIYFETKSDIIKYIKTEIVEKMLTKKTK
jgi:hypothetical protein